MSSFSTRWMHRLSETLHNHGSSNVYSLATVESVGDTLTPRVRSVVHRAILNPQSVNPILLTTTDIRAAKASQIESTENVEIAWYFKPTEEQFRITGRAALSPHPKRSSPKQQALLPPQIDWDEQRKQIFNSVSGRIRASFFRPTPGSPLPGGHEEGKGWPETLPKLGEWKSEEEHVQVTGAFENFALLVISPFRVDHVELAPTPNRRTFYALARDGEACVWEENVVVP